jgi:hypothetical protein
MNRQSPAAQVRPHRVRQWLHSHDPQFRETAALDVHSGRVLARCTDRRTQDDLVALMEEVARAHSTGRVHVVWDNLNTHRAYAYGRTSTPGTAGASSVTSRPCTPAGFNQIELLFAIYARRVLRHASHTSIAHLRQRTEVAPVVGTRNWLR